MTIKTTMLTHCERVAVVDYERVLSILCHLQMMPDTYHTEFRALLGNLTKEMGPDEWREQDFVSELIELSHKLQ